MQKHPSPRQAVLRNRKKGESRLAQSVRIGLPESTLRWIEENNRWARNDTIRARQLSTFGLSEPAKAGAK